METIPVDFYAKEWKYINFEVQVQFRTTLQFWILIQLWRRIAPPFIMRPVHLCDDNFDSLFLCVLGWQGAGAETYTITFFQDIFSLNTVE